MKNVPCTNGFRSIQDNNTNNKNLERKKHMKKEIARQ